MGRHVAELPAAEIKTLVATAPEELPVSVAAAVRDFVERIGGIENARLAVEMLERLESPEL